MNKKRKTIIALLALLIVFGTADAAEPTNTQNKTAVKSQTPIVIEADELYYGEDIGDLYAKGNVKITQNQEQLTTDLLRGNTKETVLRIDGDGNLTQPGLNLTGSGIVFNYEKHTGTMDKAKGLIGNERVSGDSFDTSPEHLQFHNGTMTRCPAKIPDYHISADKIEVWPGQKMIAYNAKFWIKDKVIFTLPKYQRTLGDKKQNSNSEFPRLGYNTQDGLAVKQYLEYPFTEKLAAWTDLVYYSKAGFKPSYGLLDRENGFTVKVSAGHMTDSNSKWIKKEPEIKVDFDTKHIGNSPISYTFSALYGKWIDDKKTSWHQDYNLYFNRDPIQLSPSLTWTLGTGVEHVRESYDDSNTTSFKFDTGLTKVWSPNFSTWAVYHYTKNHNRLFEYEDITAGRSLDAGFRWTIDKMNTVEIAKTYNIENGQTTDLDYTWRRNLHCWELDLTYRAKRGQWRYDITTMRF